MILQFQIERKNKIENSSRTAWGGTIAPAITSHYFKAGVRDFLFALAIPHCCLIIEYE